MNGKNHSLAEQVFASASSGDSLVLENLLRNKNADLDVCDQYGITPLMEACRFGRANIVSLLLEARANVNAADKEKGTVLMHASAGAASIKIMAVLIKHGAKRNKRDVFGCTALMRAASRGNAKIVKDKV